MQAFKSLRNLQGFAGHSIGACLTNTPDPLRAPQTTPRSPGTFATAPVPEQLAWAKEVFKMQYVMMRAGFHTVSYPHYCLGEARLILSGTLVVCRTIKLPVRMRKRNEIGCAQPPKMISSTS